MAEYDLDRLVLIVTGTTLRAEDVDRPLANRLAEEVRKRLPSESGWRCLVISDVYYINDEDLRDCPVISVGGPGVNHLAGVFLRELSPALAIDGILLIQMDVALEDLRASIWGMDHEKTVEALNTFIGKGYLDRFIQGVLRQSGEEPV